MRKKTSTIMAWLLAASVTVTSLSAGTVTAYAQEEMPLAEAGTVTESGEAFGDSSDNGADIAGEGNLEAEEDQESAADTESTADQESAAGSEDAATDVSDVDLTEPDTPDAEQPADTEQATDVEQPEEDETGDGEEISADTDAADDFSSGSADESELEVESNELALDEGDAAAANAAPADAEYWCGHYYKVYDSVKSPSAAAEFCKSQGGYLATITSDGENDVVQGLLRNKSSRLNGYLLGGTHNESAAETWDLQYSWSNGEKNLLSFYGVGNRRYMGNIPVIMGSGDQLAMCGTLDYYNKFGWIWYDSSKSDQSYGFICEWGDPLDVAKGEVTLSSDRFVVNGQPQKPEVTVTYEGQKLEENHDYTYDFSNNINIGKARCTIKGTGRFNGQQTVTFDIVPSKIKELRGNNFLATDTGTAYTNADRKMEVAWDKASDNKIDGYDIWYSKSEKFESYKEYSVDKSKTEFTSGSLDRGATYYAKVRAYKQVPEGKIEGEWSNVLTVKVGKQVLVNEMWGCHNDTAKVSASYYYKLFSGTPAQADEIYKEDGGTSDSPAKKKGICYGMVMSGVAAYDVGVPSDLYGLSSLNKVSEFSETDKYSSNQLGMSAKDAIIYAHLSQKLAPEIKIWEKNANNLYGFYWALQDCQKGKNGPVCIMIGESGDGYHEILAIGITDETDEKVEIAVYDPNRENDKEARLYLLKENGTLVGWSYIYPPSYKDAITYKGKASTADEEGDVFTYEIETPSLIADNLKRISADTYNSFNDLKNYSLVTAYSPSGKKANASFMEYFKNKMKNNSPVYSTDGTSETTYQSFWVRNNSWISMDDVPAGVVLSVASADHMVSVTTTQKANVTINAADTNANKVYVTSSTPGSFTATFKDYTDLSEPVKETTVNATCKANTTVTVNQTADQKIQLNGAESASYTRDEGTRNTDTGLLDNAKREEMKNTTLDAEKSYQIERKDSDLVLSTSSKNNNNYDEVVQTTPADHKHTWDSGKVTKEATCKEEGVKTYTCSGCGQTKTEAIAKTTTHKWSAWKTVTEAKVGVKGSKQRTCSVCGKTETAEIPALSSVSKIKITGFSTKYISGNVRATIKWNAVSKAKKYRICYGYVNNKSYSRKEKSATAARSITVTKPVSFSASNRFWVEAYDSNGKLCGKSDEKYYTDTTIGYYDILPYTGKAQVPYVEVRVQDQFLKKGRDFTVTATNSTYPGKGEAQIRLKGNFRGVIRKPLTIRLKETSISSLTAGKKYFTLKWKKGSTGVSGYQIQYSTAANFKKAKTVTVKSVKTLSRKISGLKKGRYYVRIRTYGKIKGKTCYSSWSGAKKATVK